MKPNPLDLRKISYDTLGHYNERAEYFWEGTRDHDVRQNIAELLRYVESALPYTLLDFGCGPGRDLRVFTEFGHIAVGLDGARRFVEMARTYSECEVWQQDFLKLDLPQGYFDGIFANASLFHVPGCELPRVLKAACVATGQSGQWRSGSILLQQQERRQCQTRRMRELFIE